MTILQTELSKLYASIIFTLSSKFENICQARFTKQGPPWITVITLQAYTVTVVTEHKMHEIKRLGASITTSYDGYGCQDSK